MKIIYQNNISADPTSTVGIVGSSADYNISRVLNKTPKQPYIPNQFAGSGGIACVLTIVLKSAASSATSDAFFMSYLAESAVLNFYSNTGASSEISGTSLTFTNTYDVNGYDLLDRTIASKSIYTDIPSGTLAIKVTLNNTTNHYTATPTADRITKFAGNATSGQLTKSDDSSILYEDYPEIKLGSIFKSSSSVYQVTRLTGDGSGSSDVKLNGATGNLSSLDAIYLPIYVNTIRCGKQVSIFNPSVGLNVERQTFGILNEKDSGLNYRLGEIRKVFSGSVQILESERITILGVIDSLRYRPVAAKILNYQDESAVFGSFLDMPGFAYSSGGSKIYDMSISFTEII